MSKRLTICLLSTTLLVLVASTAAAIEPPGSCLATPANGSVTVSWAEVTGATGLTALSHVDSTVTNDTTYYYVVTASDGVGESAVSPEDPATPRNATFVSGLIGSYDNPITTTWDLAGSPYVVIGDIEVRGNRDSNSYNRTSTLIIESGVQVLFEVGTGMVIGHDNDVVGRRRASGWHLPGAFAGQWPDHRPE